MNEFIEIQHQEAVTTLWLNRPEVHNAFSSRLVIELSEAFDRIAGDAVTRVVVIAARGKSFSAGGDLGEMKAAGQASMEENMVGAQRFAETLRAIAQLDKPTIARVQGAALGGGMGLAAACDICIASDNASFATSEVRFGVIPAIISPYVIRAIGERQAARYFLTAERISAMRAAELGLVHECVPADALDAKVAEIVSALLQGGPKAQAAAKDLIRTVIHRPLDDALLSETSFRIANQRAQPEAGEGLSAFLEKRTAAWVPPKG